MAAALTVAASTACTSTASDQPRASGPRPSAVAASDLRPSSATASHPYVGMWVTADGHIRHELLPDGRYDEARGDRASAYTGRYWVTGDYIQYRDDTGFSADGRFDGDVLYHAGFVLYREKPR